MIWDELVEKMLKQIAKELKLKFSKIRRDNFILSKGEKFISFGYFVELNNTLKLIMSKRGALKPIDMGNYTMDDLKFENSDKRRTLTVKINKEFE